MDILHVKVSAARITCDYPGLVSSYPLEP
jgi:hypothetical protein